jgi:2,3-bisphosphoglycerate-independent phosphoglycerate mutase
MTKTCLVVIDGWGCEPNETGNAVAAAKTPCMSSLQQNYPSCQLSAHGLDVGLPDGLSRFLFLFNNQIQWEILK